MKSGIENDAKSIGDRFVEPMIGAQERAGKYRGEQNVPTNEKPLWRIFSAARAHAGSAGKPE
ncbi:hypothetical protein [Burkholderia oklahomensis]|uniref:hypothetical protein n=1 Tax=Burkholderia oklahomensis TaxID=342113 RepID=UPI0002E181AD|nr:hypothetical protein [Burkholderia oklahomensis]MBI0362712.1 hypothetical protein [Burkholderia oklahomensis]QPS40267.1 hypothetical protein I6G57_31385 [Burkholderia oklahomensis]